MDITDALHSNKTPQSLYLGSIIQTVHYRARSRTQAPLGQQWLQSISYIVAVVHSHSSEGHDGGSHLDLQRRGPAAERHPVRDPARPGEGGTTGDGGEGTVVEGIHPTCKREQHSLYHS